MARTTVANDNNNDSDEEAAEAILSHLVRNAILEKHQQAERERQEAVRRAFFQAALEEAQAERQREQALRQAIQQRQREQQQAEQVEALASLLAFNAMLQK